jgi:hypothetical protein
MRNSFIIAFALIVCSTIAACVQQAADKPKTEKLRPYVLEVDALHSGYEVVHLKFGHTDYYFLKHEKYHDNTTGNTTVTMTLFQDGYIVYKD